MVHPTAPAGLPKLIGFTSAVLVACFVLVSSLIALSPEFAFESQVPAVLPFTVWAAAPGVAFLAAHVRALTEPWRRSLGYASLVPYAALMVGTAAAPDARLPWWLAVVASVSAAVPFVVASFRQPGRRRTAERRITPQSNTGTFLIGLALMLMTYGLGGPELPAAIVQVLLAAALVLGSLTRAGVAHAGTAWRLRHWISLAFGSVVSWAAVVVRAHTAWFEQPGVLFAAVVAAGLPLIVVNALDVRRRAPEVAHPA